MKKQNTIRISAKSISIIIFFLIIFNIFIISMLVIYLQQNKSDNTFHTYVIGQSTKPGYAGVELHYDVEPVDIYLIHPDGREFTKNYVSLYEANINKKTIRLLMDTKTLGTWSIRFNNKRNKNITYKFINIPSDTLYLQEVELIKKSGTYVLSFVPVCGEPTDTETLCKYSITMTNDDKSFVLESGNAGINQTIEVPLKFHPSAYDDTKYKLSLSVVMLDNNDNRDKVQLSLHLNKKPDDNEDLETEDDNK